MSKSSDTTTHSADIQRSIDQTRSRMDRTLDEVADRFHPRHLIDEVVELFRSEKGSDKRQKYFGQAKAVGREVLRCAQKHPGPALLSGAAAFWLLAETLANEVDDVASRMSEASEPWPAVAPWSKGHEWSQSPIDEQTWADKAQAALSELGSTLNDMSVKAKDKVRAAASTVVSLSGRNRRDIHAQWANLREYSGSFVDARTGKPYDDSYGKEIESLRASEFASTHDWSDEDERNWSEKAEHMLDEVRVSLADTTRSARDHLATMSTALGSFVGATAGMASDYGQRLREAGGRITTAARDEGRRIEGKLKDGYAASRESMAEAMDAYPLAFAGICLGAGLIAGALLPTTKLERESLGAASEQLEEKLDSVIREGARRTSEVADAALSAAAEAVTQS